MSFDAIGPVVLVGAGKMGLALARGWLASGLKPADLILIDPQPGATTQEFAREHGVRLQADPAGVTAKVLVLAVKPQIIAPVMAQAKAAVDAGTLVLSVAAGIAIGTLASGLGTSRVIRTMPNTPAQIGKGITGAVAGFAASDADRSAADALLGAAGAVVWFDDEGQLDAVTAVSGSGPAYVFHFVEALAAAGERQGLAPDAAMRLARQTVIGAAGLLEADPAAASTLRENVTSPNGTTAAALAVLMGDEGLSALLDKAVGAARRRSEELGRG